MNFVDSHLESKAVAYSQKYNTSVESGRMAVRLMMIAEASRLGMPWEQVKMYINSLKSLAK